jgi:hypothetical protein
LFCLYRWDPPNRDAADRVLGLFGSSGWGGGLHGLGPQNCNTTWNGLLSPWKPPQIRL